MTYQVASQFNTLEAPSSSAIVDVSEYFTDRTQARCPSDSTPSSA